MTEKNREAEAGEKKVGTFEFRGRKFKVPLERPDWSLDMLEAIEDGKDVALIRGAVGPVQWPLIKAMHLNVGEFGELAGECLKALGFGSSGE